MGGGAGIQFTLKLGSGRGHLRENHLVVDALPGIESFDMEGYQDGMRRIRGDLLKITHFRLPALDPEDSAHIRRQYGRGVKERSFLEFDGCEGFKTMFFAGYIRGDIQKCFPCWLTGEVQILSSLRLDASLCVVPADREEFGLFYKDIFNWLPESTPGCCATCHHTNTDAMEQETEEHEADCKMNWGLQHAQ